MDPTKGGIIRGSLEPDAEFKRDSCVYNIRFAIRRSGAGNLEGDIGGPHGGEQRRRRSFMTET
jgi:hypothetical protein